ncbi:DUF1656 domain-containing protein [Pseudoroseomonas globiformis]|uniref:DUF1656 domain-containing protein n=1 Tax=Teichococcus globiformis TaxID=2307229 RepID=A0ABV7G3P6_9PROT
MIAEIDLYGIYLPALLVWALLAVPLTALLRRALARLGAYRWVWHRPLFDLALFVIVLGGITALMELLPS